MHCMYKNHILMFASHAHEKHVMLYINQQNLSSQTTLSSVHINKLYAKKHSHSSIARVA